MFILNNYSAEKPTETAAIATASETRLIKNDILHSISFLNKNDNGANRIEPTSPTMDSGSAIMLTAGTLHDNIAQVSAAVQSNIISTDRHSVIIGTIFFML